MERFTEEKLTKCYHCGESCDGSIFFEQKPFCCDGCKTVYEILNQNNLCEYYNLNNGPGVSLKNSNAFKKYAYLDDEHVKSKLVRYSDDDISIVTFYIPKIHCSSCIYLLENLYKLNQGIKRTNIHFTSRTASITFSQKQISLRGVVELLVSIGYEPQINLNDVENHEKKNNLRQYYLKIGVAFFAAGNIMLLSFPEYLGINLKADPQLRQFFNYLNFLLSLPLLLYCAQEFFVSAYTAARRSTLNMDVPIAIGIAAMFVRSSYEIFSQTGAGYFDTLGSLILLMLIGRLFQNKTYETLSFERDYKSYFPVAVNVLTGDTEKSVPLAKLQTGARILVRNQELIPADAILMTPSANIDYSFVTGEATPVYRKGGDLIYAGGKNTGNTIELETVKDVSQSYLTQLWNDAAFEKDRAATITPLATKISFWFTPVVLIIAFASLAFWYNTDIHRALNAFTSVLIITCPCALALSSPFTLGNVIRILSRNKIYIKNTLAIESMAQIDTIVFDKTGTITNTGKSAIEFAGPALSTYEMQLVKSLARHSSHPLSKKIAASLKNISTIRVDNFKEIEGNGIEGWIDENWVKVGSGKYVGAANQIMEKNDTGFRNASTVYIAVNGMVKGFFLIKNEYREGFTTLIEDLKQKATLYVVSGDNDNEREYLQKYLNADNLIFYQQPADKLNFIKQLQLQGKKVMMIGDGLNDAGALRQADIGLVISDDVNNFSPACDAIIEASRFPEISSLLGLTHTAVNIIKASFFISLCYNAVGMFLAVQGTMSPIVAAILMPISSVSIISFTTIASGIAAVRSFAQKGD